jgi:hypothetical protein
VITHIKKCESHIFEVKSVEKAPEISKEGKKK